MSANDGLRETAIWIYHALRIAEPIPLLRQALLALSMTRHGRVTGNLELIRRGQRTYGTALRLLRDALYDRVLTWNDETLASVRALVLYEFFESNSDNPTAWYRHLDGITSLASSPMEARGPERTSSSISRSVLEDIRYALMLKDVMLRKRSAFGRDDWIDLPWCGRAKPIEQQVYDQGFRIAAILERSDLVVQSPTTGHQGLRPAIDLLQTCNDLRPQMDDLFRHTFKPFLQAKSADWTRSLFDKTPDSIALTPADINQLTLVVNLWSCMLLMAWIADALRDRLLDALDAGRIVTKDDVAHAKDLCEVSSSYTNQCALTDLALAILQYFPLCVGPGASELAVNRMLFPLTCILWQFRYSESHFRKATALMWQISEARNVKFAAPGYSVIALIPPIARDDGGLLSNAVDRLTRLRSILGRRRGHESTPRSTPSRGPA
ncbi:hypothetical protein H2200_011590 [Cladophialophora chaetospira]|uniref:C6 transcription factor n=1 Tax=Cladophialophora chaetospira TaxID=386627 RepID=A0AA38WZQ1_9EURO|nr:hypothetical protein H2200_011590 [Cladophialophora chaetospira]